MKYLNCILRTYFESDRTLDTHKPIHTHAATHATKPNDSSLAGVHRKDGEFEWQGPSQTHTNPLPRPKPNTRLSACIIHVPRRGLLYAGRGISKGVSSSSRFASVCCISFTWFTASTAMVQGPMPYHPYASLISVRSRIYVFCVLFRTKNAKQWKYENKRKPKKNEKCKCESLDRYWLLQFIRCLWTFFVNVSAAKCWHNDVLTHTHTPQLHRGDIVRVWGDSSGIGSLLVNAMGPDGTKTCTMHSCPYIQEGNPSTTGSQ